jgi:hypothetical protein
MSDPIIYSTVFKYTNSADSAKPGYLKNKFDRIRREQADAEKAKPKARIIVLGKGAK